MGWFAWALATATIGLVGCFGPELRVSCGAQGVCPSGFACDDDGFCIEPTTLRADGAPPLIDAAPTEDAAPADALGPACAASTDYGDALAGSTYRFDPTPNQSWNEARATCQADGADLAVIESAAENDHLRAALSPVVQFWIGLRADGTAWTWVDGTPLANNYENWRNGEPAPNDNDCARWRLSNVATGQWFRDPCSRNLGMMCECAGAAAP